MMYMLHYHFAIECVDGLYGENCTKQCSKHCKDETICNHKTGHCDRGCDSGWAGSLCNTGI